MVTLPCRGFTLPCGFFANFCLPFARSFCLPWRKVIRLPGTPWQEVTAKFRHLRDSYEALGGYYQDVRPLLHTPLPGGFDVR